MHQDHLVVSFLLLGRSAGPVSPGQGAEFQFPVRFRGLQEQRQTRLTVSQLRFVNKAFWPNPASAFFTFALPLIFLVIFTSSLGQGQVNVAGHVIHLSTYYVAAMATFAVITTCYNNTAISLTVQRDTGVLKRINGVPLPSAVYSAARVLHALLVSVLLVAITMAFGVAAYQADIPDAVSLLRLLVTLVAGAASFCALGFAITAVIPNSDAAAPIVYATILPLLFLSGVVVPDRRRRLDHLDRTDLPGQSLRRRHPGGTAGHPRAALLRPGIPHLTRQLLLAQDRRLANNERHAAA